MRGRSLRFSSPLFAITVKIPCLKWRRSLRPLRSPKSRCKPGRSPIEPLAARSVPRSPAPGGSPPSRAPRSEPGCRCKRDRDIGSLNAPHDNETGDRMRCVAPADCSQGLKRRDLLRGPAVRAEARQTPAKTLQRGNCGLEPTPTRLASQLRRVPTARAGNCLHQIRIGKAGGIERRARLFKGWRRKRTRSSSRKQIELRLRHRAVILPSPAASDNRFEPPVGARQHQGKRRLLAQPIRVGAAPMTTSILPHLALADRVGGLTLPRPTLVSIFL